MTIEKSADILCKLNEIALNLKDLQELTLPRIFVNTIQKGNRTIYAVVDFSWQIEFKKLQRSLSCNTQQLVPYNIQGGHNKRNHDQIFCEMLNASLLGNECWLRCDIVNGFPSVKLATVKKQLESVGLQANYLDFAFIDFKTKTPIEATGLIQGLSHSPTLFCFYLSEVLKNLNLKSKFSSFIDDLLLRGESENVVKEEGERLVKLLAEAGLNIHSSGPKAARLIRSTQKLEHLGLIFDQGIYPTSNCLFYVTTLLRLAKSVAVNQQTSAQQWLMNALGCDTTTGQSVNENLKVIQSWLAGLDTSETTFSDLWAGEKEILHQQPCTYKTLHSLGNLLGLLRPMSMGQTLPAGWAKSHFRFQWYNCGFFVEEGIDYPLLGTFSPAQFEIRNRIFKSVSELNFDPKEDDDDANQSDGCLFFEFEERQLLAQNKKVHVALELHSRLIMFAPYNFLTQQYFPLQRLSMFPYPKKSEHRLPMEIINCFFFNEVRFISQLNSDSLNQFNLPERKIKLLLRGLTNIVFIKLAFPKIKIKLTDFYLIQLGRFVWMDFYSSKQVATLFMKNKKKRLSQNQFRKKITEIINQQKGVLNE